MKKINLHHQGSEYLEKCKNCGGKVTLIREGSIMNPVSDITKCDCIEIEHQNSVEIMGQKLHFGENKIVTH